MENLTLHYFNVRGRGEATRLLLAAAGVDYKDVRVSKNEYPEKKPGLIYGTMPVLEVDGVQIGQSGSIIRYIASCTGLGGESPLEQAQLDAMFETIIDVREVVGRAFFEKDEALKPQKMKEASEKAAANFGLLEKQLEKNGGPFFAGERMTYPDIQMYSVAEIALPLQPELLKPFPKLQALFDKVAQEPKVAKYIKDRPETPF